MSISIDENIIAVWFCDLGPSEDYMMALSRHEGGIRFVYRVRHHNPDSTDPFDGKDDKSWSAFQTSDPDERKAIGAAREMVKGLIGVAVGIGRVTLPAKIYELIRGDQSVDDFGALLLKQPWAHSQRKTLQ
jgi:hypothetical protein